ncbi:MAG: HAD hydrolase-like protein [Clostridia bacterium]|nr:HAD hydrolase-like protein [Clostridia bacterium]
MGKYSVIAFDLDGTLSDPSEGLLNGFEYAFKKLGIDYGERDSLRRFIGPPLFDEWQAEFGFTPEEAEKAILLFREYYKVYGWRENRVYDGIYKLLEELKRSGKTLVMATSKPEDQMIKIVRLFGFDKYFDFLGGAGSHKSRHRKCDVLEYALAAVGIGNSPEERAECILVGDRKYDAEGASICGIASLGVLWGHGNYEEITSSGFSLVASTPAEVLGLLG